MTDDMREAFEEWGKQSMTAGQTNSLMRKESGEYLWSGTSLCWDVWQAAIASKPKVSEDIGNLLGHMASVVGSLVGWDKENTAAFDSAQHVLDTLRKMYEPSKPQVTEGELREAIYKARYVAGNDYQVAMNQASTLLQQFEIRRK